MKREILEKITDGKMVEFVKARKETNLFSFSSKYTPLSSKGGLKTSIRANMVTAMSNSSLPKGNGHLELFPSEKLKDYAVPWEMKKVGCGLGNLGNTCYMNSVLQAILYIPYIYNYLQSKIHSSTCPRKNEFCSVCEAEKLLMSALTSRIAYPKAFVRNLRLIGRNLRPGRQEDSHEFLLSLFSKLKKDSASSLHLSDEELDTSFFAQTLLGRYSSTVTCSTCKFESETVEPFFDINLDLKSSRSIENSLEKFTEPEVLDGDNMYFCENCNAKVRATKQMGFKSLPPVLLIQLKRFSGGMGIVSQKIGRRIEFGESLDLNRFCKRSGAGSENGTDAEYELQSIVSHMGMSARSGHYIAFSKAPNGTWYLFNDASSSQVGIQRVLNASAYILVYTRKLPKSERTRILKKMGRGQKGDKAQDNLDNKISKSIKEEEKFDVGGLLWSSESVDNDDSGDENEIESLALKFTTEHTPGDTSSEEAAKEGSEDDSSSETSSEDEGAVEIESVKLTREEKAEQPIKSPEMRKITVAKPRTEMKEEYISDDELVGQLLNKGIANSSKGWDGALTYNRKSAEPNTFKKRRSRLDVEYDMGKQRKLREKRNFESFGDGQREMFDQYQQKRFKSSYGGRGGNSRGRGSGGRGRGFRGRGRRGF